MKLTVILLLVTSLLSGCTTASQKTIQAGRIDGRLKATVLPNYPTDCRKIEKSGVKKGDRLDIALKRTDNALGRQNKRVARCAKWYDRVKNKAK